MRATPSPSLIDISSAGQGVVALMFCYLARALLDSVASMGGGGLGGSDLVRRLSDKSLRSRTNPLLEIDWTALSPSDSRWEHSIDDPIADCDWFRAQTPHWRTEFCRDRCAAFFQAGIEFECALQRGLLSYLQASAPPPDVYEFLHHEVIEESQHSQMFQRFVDRCGIDRPDQDWIRQRRGRSGDYQTLFDQAVDFPELLFFHALAGEEPTDIYQRSVLVRGLPVHPVVEQLFRLHVAEEARHLAFARHFLRQHVPLLDRHRRRRLTVHVQMLVPRMAHQILDTPDYLLQLHHVPESVAQSASLAEARAVQRRRCTRRLTALIAELGLEGGALDDAS